MYKRLLQPQILESLTWNPAVAILGPRQAGKTTLALEIGKELPSLYLDMESPQDRQRLDNRYAKSYEIASCFTEAGFVLVLRP